MSRADLRPLLVAGLIAALIVLGAAALAHADDPKLPPGVTCDDVRSNVATYGYYPALLWARAKGYTPSQIREAQKCLSKRSGQ